MIRREREGRKKGRPIHRRLSRVECSPEFFYGADARILDLALQDFTQRPDRHIGTLRKRL